VDWNKEYELAVNQLKSHLQQQPKLLKHRSKETSRFGHCCRGADFDGVEEMLSSSARGAAKHFGCGIRPVCNKKKKDHE
jgi:hypothetical protein